jgi:chaperonin cofactor prefoldin
MTLKEHILQCELRYQALENRLDSLEQKMDKVQETIESFSNTIIDYAIKGAIGLVLLMAGVIFAVQI